jgi:hypothetical protein
MWSKKATLHVCLLVGLTIALAMASQSAGQNSSTATEAPSGYDNQSKPSNAWALSKMLSLRQVQANPNTYNVQDDPCRRSLCAL